LKAEEKMNQESFSTLWDGYESNKAAIAARNARARELRAQGYKVYCNSLPNQLRKYAGLGCPDGRACTVYMISYYR
jgi:hypothetical protein